MYKRDKIALCVYKDGTYTTTLQKPKQKKSVKLWDQGVSREEDSYVGKNVHECKAIYFKKTIIKKTVQKTIT